MTRKPASPVIDQAPGLRQRQKADGSWRVWWEPNAAQRARGAKPVDFDTAKPGHAAREARRLAKEWSADPVAPKPRGRSMSDLIHAYRQSRAWAQLRPTTQASYTADLRAIEGKWGPHAVALFDKPVAAAWYETNLARLGIWRAKALNTMLSILMAHAEVEGWRPENSNPCQRIKVQTGAPRRRAATRGEAAAALAAARKLRDWDMMAAILLGMAAGQRVTDIRQVAPGDFYTTRLGKRSILVWQLTQSKRGREVDVPLHPLAAALVRMLIARARRSGQATLLVHPGTGRPYTKKGMWQGWDRIRAAAALDAPSIKDLRQQDLRRTFSNLSRAGGSSVDDVTDVLGNTANIDPRLRETYMAAQLATQLRAVDAITLPAPKRRA